MLKYIISTYKIITLFFKYSILNKNDYENCKNFYNEFLSLGTVPVKIFQWIINYTYHLPSKKNNKNLLFQMFYEKIMNQCQTHDISYTKNILSKYNINIDNLLLLNSGSIGQVYKGKWNDKIVAIKILHPDVNNTTNYWFYVLKIIFFILKVTNNLKKLKLDWESLQIYFKSQFDFREEGKNLEKFYKYYIDNDYVIIPKPYFYQKDILIMDYIESQSFDILEKSCSKYLTFKMYNFMLIIMEDMFLNMPYLHGDFHNGNYGIIIKENSFKIVLYDFGLIIPNSVDICLIYSSILFKNPNTYAESLINIFKIDQKFTSVIKKMVVKEIEEENVNFNDILEIVFQNKGDIQISLESIFLITTFLNIEKFKKVSNRNILDKISILEDLNCFKKYCDNLISFYFDNDTSFLDRKNIYESIHFKERHF